tara:strand:+ start:53 stop:1180 length:1128 start_codon:yes stop_codon:yes gene_type:complete
MRITKKEINNLLYGSIPTNELKSIAFEKKSKLFGNTITFSPKVFIPLTTLCRDHCSYCTFVKSPTEGGLYLTESEVLSIANSGQHYNCTEALFTLGDKPELKWTEAKEFLILHNCESTDQYLESMMQNVLDKTSLFPHANPGLMNEDEIKRFKKCSPSGGIMIESFSDRLLKRGGPHYKCQTKNTKLRVETINAAETIKYPMTTGLLIGIGQNEEELVNDLLQIGNLAKNNKCIQEVIIQNFVPKQNTLMSSFPEPESDFFLRVIAVSRLILPNHVSLQAPPNLSKDFSTLLDSGINDLGGISPVTIDMVNPDKLWPNLDNLKQTVINSNQVLKSRLPIYPNFIEKEWISQNIYEKVLDVIDENGYTIFTTMETI